VPRPRRWPGRCATANKMVRTSPLLRHHGAVRSDPSYRPEFAAAEWPWPINVEQQERAADLSGGRSDASKPGITFTGLHHAPRVGPLWPFPQSLQCLAGQNAACVTHYPDTRESRVIQFGLLVTSLPNRPGPAHGIAVRWYSTVQTRHRTIPAWPHGGACKAIRMEQPGAVPG